MKDLSYVGTLGLLPIKDWRLLDQTVQNLEIEL